MAEEYKVPESVLDALEETRRNGQCNMMDRGCVVFQLLMLYDPGDPGWEAAMWLDEHPDRYVTALTLLGERLAERRRG